MDKGLFIWFKVRSLVFQADLYILDDPLAAVDPEVAAEIYEKCVQGFLKSKSRTRAFKERGKLQVYFSKSLE